MLSKNKEKQKLKKNKLSILLWILFFLALGCFIGGCIYYFNVQSKVSDYVSYTKDQLLKKESDKHNKNTKDKDKIKFALLTIHFGDKSQIAIKRGTSAKQLEQAAGYDPSTAAPNTKGNCVIYGHRDMVFSCLKSARIDDTFTIETNDSKRTYRIVSIQIVKPDNPVIYEPSKKTLVTFVTCYPFTFVGAAPDRCVIKGVLK